jgi:hypothetical protein
MFIWRLKLKIHSLKLKLKRKSAGVQVQLRVKSPITAMIEAATNKILVGTDHRLIGQICHEVNLRPRELSAEAIQALQSCMRKSSTISKLLALEVADAFLRNCGMDIHQLVASEEFMQDMLNMVNTNTNPNQVDDEVSARAVAMIQCWAESFKEFREILPLYYEIYKKLRFQGEILQL